MNRPSLETRARVVAALVEGNSIRSTERLIDVHRDTIVKFVVELGGACRRLHDELVRDLRSAILELDEIWAFVAKKQGHLVEGDPAEYGDAYTFVAIDATSKLGVSYVTDKRTAAATQLFCDDIRARVLGRPQIDTDGFVAYRNALDNAFGADLHHGVAIKVFEQEGTGVDQHRYSPGKVIGVERAIAAGAPDIDRISTSYVERQNLTMRMAMRRFTRLTNGFSKKLENLRAAVALHFAHYNFCRVHETLRVTPAMAAGLARRVWTIAELIQAAEASIPTLLPTTPVTMAIADAAERRANFRVIDGGRSGGGR